MNVAQGENKVLLVHRVLWVVKENLEYLELMDYRETGEPLELPVHQDLKGVRAFLVFLDHLALLEQRVNME